MADASTPFNKLFNTENVLDRLDQLETKTGLTTPVIQSVDSISTRTGELVADRIIAPAADVNVLDVTSTDFTGAFMIGDGATFNSVAYHVGGVSAGVLQAGFSAVDGSFTAGAGAVKADANGIKIVVESTDSYASTGGYNFASTDGTLIGYMSQTPYRTMLVETRASTDYLTPSLFLQSQASSDNTGATPIIKLLAYIGDGNDGAAAIILTASTDTNTIAMTGDVSISGSLTNNAQIIAGHLASATLASGLTRYTGPGMVTVITSENNSETEFLTAGTLRNLWMRTSTAQTATGNFVVRLRVNNANSGITFTIAAGAAAGDFTDETNTVAIVSGDNVTLQLNNNGTATSCALEGWSFEFVPDLS